MTCLGCPPSLLQYPVERFSCWLPGTQHSLHGCEPLKVIGVVRPTHDRAAKRGFQCTIHKGLVLNQLGGVEGN